MKNYQSNYRAIFGLMPYALAVVIILAIIQGLTSCKERENCYKCTVEGRTWNTSSQPPREPTFINEVDQCGLTEDEVEVLRAALRVDTEAGSMRTITTVYCNVK
jgi:hypothetical protein